MVLLPSLMLTIAFRSLMNIALQLIYPFSLAPEYEDLLGYP